MNVQTRRKFKTNEALSPLPVLSAAEELPGDAGIALHTIDDSDSIQRALSVVINAVAAGTLDPARARVLLYGLQIASTNARRMASAPKAGESARAEKKTAAADKHTVASPAVAGLQEPQPVCVDQAGQVEQEDTEAIAKDDASMEAGTESRAQPLLNTEPTTYARHVRIPPSCFSPASEYSSGVRDRLLAARQRSKLRSGV